ncbi:MAG: cob(I)yrinic acid a,c-diamide adenosyltransferase [Acidobacteria bacterium]|jgi:cob(I)alamin adenosyltransferase|nr:cob(I)yrinic acid a,c-diamide adenosyltransferase [Acidobacteriota bacterium]
MEFTGCIQVYTGNGKGKTTAALGLALRAAGRGMKTYMAQFMKKGEYGELLAVARHLAGLVTIEQFGLPEFHHRDRGVSPAEVQAAEAGLAAAAAAIACGDYQIVVLDEINTLLHFQIVPVEPVLRLMDDRPAGVELVLTGRYAPQAVLDRADLVTEMREVRHYYQKGLQARTGIEK